MNKLKGILNIVNMVLNGLVLVAGLVIGGYLISRLVSSEKNTDKTKLVQTNQPKDAKKSVSSVDNPELLFEKSQQVRLYDTVNFESVSIALSQIEKLSSKNPDKPIWLMINTPGGSVFDGMRLAELVKNSKTPVYTVCVGICASMGFIIHQHGQKRYVFEYSTLMSHPISMGSQDNMYNIKSRVDYIFSLYQKIMSYIASRSKLSTERLIELSKSELYIESADAYKMGFADKVIHLELEKESDGLDDQVGRFPYSQVKKDTSHTFKIKAVW
jgi:ATP-dependent Clp protease protease subunit